MMLRPRVPVATALFFALIALITGCLAYSYISLWDAHVRAVIATPAAVGSEERLLLTAMVASGVSVVLALVSAFAGAMDRSRVLRSESRKKSIELHTEGAFAVWKAATAAYRYLQLAEANRATSEHITAASKGFEDAEGATLLFDQVISQQFRLLWNETDRIGAAVLAADAAQGGQAQVWTAEIRPYAKSYLALQSSLQVAVNG